MNKIKRFCMIMQRLVKMLSKFYCKQKAHGSCCKSALQQTTEANEKKNHRKLCKYVQAMMKSSENTR